MSSIRRFMLPALLAVLVSIPVIGQASKGENISVVYPLTQVSPRDSQATVEFKVTDASGAPVHGALVRFAADGPELERKSDVTDKGGIVRAQANIPPAVGESYTVTATAKDVDPVTARIEVVPSVPSSVAFIFYQGGRRASTLTPGSEVEVRVFAWDQLGERVPGREDDLVLSANGVTQPVTWTWEDGDYVTKLVTPEAPARGVFTVTVGDPVSTWRPSAQRKILVRESDL